MTKLSLVFAVLMGIFLSCKGKSKSEYKVDISPELEAHGPSIVEVIKKRDTFTLNVNGKPFFIRGAGLEFGSIAALAEHNGNSFRTWRTNNGKKSAKEILDEAYKHKLMVTMGLEMGSERHGFDYDDTDRVEVQKDRIRKEVLAIKDHPALLTWCIGNELNLNYTNPKVWYAVNDIAKMIHEIDGNHPTTTTLAGITQREVDFIRNRCPHIDILSIQMYGDLPNLPRLIERFDWEGPYMVTEWGATGHWEVPTTDWGAPIEENSSVKAKNYQQRYQSGIATDYAQCLGSYVFLWGNKQERTPTWYGIFLENGNETQAVDVMHYLWNNEWPSNQSPQVLSFVLDGKTARQNIYLKAGKEYKAEFFVTDPDNDSLTFSWEMLPESKSNKEGGDYEARPENMDIAFRTDQGSTSSFTAPMKQGAYRLFAYASDGKRHTATANIPFYVRE